MPDTGGTSIGHALVDAIRALRVRVGDDAAHVAIVVPSRVNGTLARRELALVTPYVRVTFVTPAGIADELVALRLTGSGLRREPPGWMRATLAGLVKTAPLPEAYARVFAEHGWLGALTATVATLEAGGVSTEALRGVVGDAQVRERAGALAVLLDGVNEARAKDRIAAPADVARFAREAIAAKDAVPANAPQAAILLGDVHGSRLTFDVLRAWLGERPVVRVAPGPFASMNPAPLGITEAAPMGTELVELAVAPSTVALVRTLDPVREAVEAVREVWRHARSGVALDRIALVLPDASACGAVRQTLERAGMPATFQVGPPLAETEAARFARLLLQIAIDDGSVASIYELLSMSSLRIRRVLGADATRGRGRWRRILSKCGAYRGLQTIERALLARSQEGANEDGTPEEREARTRAQATLLAAIGALRTLVERLREDKSIGAHARGLREVLTAWWPPTPDQRALALVLESWGRSSAGPAISLAAFSEAIDEALIETPFLSGSLREQTVRVLSPMQLVGASFDAVIATGLVEGRMPVRPSEDPILSDALVDAVNTATRAGLLKSEDRVGIERRRFASIRSAASGVLWLSTPASDPSNGRPLLPGSLLLEMLRETDPTIGYEALEKKRVLVGRVTAPWPEDPSDALGSDEHLLARLHGRDTDRAARARGALVDHAVARRTLEKLRGEDRVVRGERSPELRRWAGFVEPALLPCPGLDGTVIDIDRLRALVDGPETFLRRWMLGAWRAPRLDESWDPVSWFFARRKMLEAAQAVLTSGARDLGAALRTENETRVGDALSRAGVLDDELRERLRRMSDAMLRAIVRAAPVSGSIVEVSAAAIADDLPWRVEGGHGRRHGSGLEWVVEETKFKTSIQDQSGALIEAAAHGSAMSVLRAIDMFGRVVDDDRGTVDELLDRVREATVLARAGLFPGEKKWSADVLDSWEAPT